MYASKTKDGNIVLNHNADWSGEVRVVVIRDLPDRYVDCQIEGPALISGDFERPVNCPLTDRELRRATALAMCSYLTSQMSNKLEGLVDGLVTPGV
jgi:hypothetical protein